MGKEQAQLQLREKSLGIGIQHWFHTFLNDKHVYRVPNPAL
jgi:hypothetical protein